MTANITQVVSTVITPIDGIVSNSRHDNLVSTCTCTKAIHIVTMDKTTGSRHVCTSVSLMTKMKDVDNARMS